VYSRNGSDGGFGVSGKLWNGVLVMYDRGTESFWTQIDGRAIEGPRTGERLDHVPSTFTTWSAWVEAHPDTLVLEKPEEIRGWEHSRYEGYLADPERLFLPELSEGLGGVGVKDVVFGVRLGDAQLAVTEDLLRERGVVNGVVGKVPVAWVRFAPTGRVGVYSRRRGGSVVLLEAAGGEGQVRDVLTGRVLHVDQLDALRVDRAFWYAWKRTHPGSLVLTR
jgi:hypothetical protein